MAAPNQTSPVRDEERLCLHLQNRAEQRWLWLRGVKGPERVEIMRKHAFARAQLHGKYERKLRRRWDIVNKLEKKIRSYEHNNALTNNLRRADSRHRAERAERLERWQKNAEEDLKMEREEASSLEEMVRQFAPRTPSEISTKPRRLPRPTPELLAVVQRKYTLVYPDGQ
ncbi:hypothetical protein PQX77_022137 [Marasmius sp. AFHP31]|nr:hypothetical protein PQX77_022137 [Marasmius sp. AFHP31]